MMSGQIHSEAFEFAERYPGTDVLGPVRDRFGVYAYEMRRSSTGRMYFFVTKRAGKGGLISIHEDLVRQAAQKGREIVMHFGKHDYLIDPRVIVRNKDHTNEFHGAVMINFWINKVGARNIAKMLSEHRQQETKKQMEPYKGDPIAEHDRIARLIDPDAVLLDIQEEELDIHADGNIQEGGTTT